MTYKLDNLEVTDVEVDGLDMKDYPDFVDAYIESAKFVSSGKELNDEQQQRVKTALIKVFVLTMNSSFLDKSLTTISY